MLTHFGLARGRPAFREPIDESRVSPQGLEACRMLVREMWEPPGIVEIPFPLEPGTKQELRIAMPDLCDLDSFSRAVVDRVLKRWRAHFFSVIQIDKRDEVLLATGLVVPDDDSSQAYDAFGELLEMLLVAALAQRIAEPTDAKGPALEPFTSHEIIDAKPALFLNVQHVTSPEQSGRLLSFAGHYSLALLAEGVPQKKDE